MVNQASVSYARAQMEALTIAHELAKDPLSNASSAVFDEATMSQWVPEDCMARFKKCLETGDPTNKADQSLIADGMFRWARGLGATDFAHWFFPMRGGGGAVGGMLGALKMDAFIDLDWSSKANIKPFKTTFPPERLFGGETDGSSFPNGGLRVTHAAAAFTSWDRASPCFISGKCLRIPCAFVTHNGKCIDEKTPLLRSQDAINREGLRLLKNVNISTDAKSMSSYLGWEQEFFVVDAAMYKARPDLVNTGRTLFGTLPERHQQGDLNYFGSVPARVDALMTAVQTEMLKTGTPMNVRHNEVAPGQHEMCPIFCVQNASADNNVYFMEVCKTEAQKLGLAVLFHEKPFAGINGSGKHANWSVGTDTGVNWFSPGKTDDEKKLFTTAVAALAWGLKEHNELVRCAVAHAGNDHRLGAQEAPPAIISLYPGTGFEKHVDNILGGGSLLGYDALRAIADPACRASMGAPAGAEDRNRTAPFPFCGNRFEFRAVGSSQNCAFPMMIVNAIMAAGMSHISDKIESGVAHRDAVAETYKESREIIFTGNGYSADWPVEAAKRGLPNLKDTVAAIPHFASDKNMACFEKLKIYSKEETVARVEVMYEAYNTALMAEAKTMITMVQTGFMPAFAKDLAIYAGAPALAGDRAELYTTVKAECDALKALLTKVPHDLAAEATFFSERVKPAMAQLRASVDKSEGIMEKSLYPYPAYEEVIYSHHF